MTESFDSAVSDGRVFGFLLGTVLENNDKEKKGMLKIRLGNEGASKNICEGVKVMSPFAGKAYGVYILPEIGEQVIVGFLDGCFDRPFVLGSVYAAADTMLSESFDDSNYIKRFKTKGGTVVEFCDKDGEETITVKTPKELSIVMKEKPQTITVSAASTSIEIDGKNGKISANAEKEILLKTGSAELSMKSGGDILLKGGSVEVSASSKAVIKSSGTLELKGNKTELSGSVVELKSSGIMTIKGSITKIN